mgnify:CR=1 FL=1
MKYLGTYDGNAPFLFGTAGSQNGITTAKLNELIAGTKVYQCPSQPFQDDIGNTKKIVKLDYVASAMSIPYTKRTLDYDSGNLEPVPFPEWKGIPSNPQNPEYDYISEYNLLKFPKETSTGRIAWITEAHASMALVTQSAIINPNQVTTPRFHHFFLGSMLPFAGRPRIADDKRHPGGIVLQFFDGHANRVPVSQVDVGWPKSLGQRMRYFSILGPDLQDHW